MELIPSEKIPEKFNFLKEKNDKKSLLKTIEKAARLLFGIFIIVQLVSLTLIQKDMNMFEVQHANATPASEFFLNYKKSDFEEIYKKANIALISGSGQDTQNVLNYLTSSLDNPDKKNNLTLPEQIKLYSLINDFKYTNLDNAFKTIIFYRENCFLGINSNLFSSCIMLNSSEWEKIREQTKQKIDLKMSYMEKKLK